MFGQRLGRGLGFRGSGSDGSGDAGADVEGAMRLVVSVFQGEAQLGEVLRLGVMGYGWSVEPDGKPERGGRASGLGCAG